MPLYLSGDIPHLIDAYFETASGFTTTGASILSSVDALARGTLFWRSFTHFIGGMGFLVFTLAVIPNSTSDSVNLMKAEVPGPVFGKLVSRLKASAQILYYIYIAITAILVVILLFLKVPLFDALLLSFGTAGTGGFSVHDAGFDLYAYPKIVEYVIGIGMLIFGVNFNLYYLMLVGHVSDWFKDEEFRYYIGIIGVAVSLIMFNLWNHYEHIEELFRHTFFTVASIITTTGFSTADFNEWPLFSRNILLLLMFIGGSAGSTAGGIKISRVMIYIKSFKAELKRVGHPNRVVTPKLIGKPLSKYEYSLVSHYLLVYIATFLGVLFIICLDAPDFLSAFSSVAATLNNIGPGFEAVGPTQNFALYNYFSKFILSVTMIAGRLEIYPILILLSPISLANWQLRLKK